ncbi:MAG: hypothetical protein KDB27_16170 [Planctomycetales bacterium]|nr:hypothetical protein [Planctomycetales bacterium]
MHHDIGRDGMLGDWPDVWPAVRPSCWQDSWMAGRQDEPMDGDMAGNVTGKNSVSPGIRQNGQQDLKRA